MNNSTDTFEKIAQDAVKLLVAIVDDLANSPDAGDLFASEMIRAVTKTFCERAIAIGAE